ncbi:MAG TPA: hypothetical protein V6C76_11790 [Drouetiella sp.]
MALEISPNNVAPWLEWGGDFVVSQNGSIVMANGWAQFRQRYLRRLFTNPAFKLLSGAQVEADYIFDANYGLGFRRRLGELWTDDMLTKLESLCQQGAEIDADVDSTQPPIIVITQDPQHTINVAVTVYLKTSQQGTIAFSIDNT